MDGRQVIKNSADPIWQELNITLEELNMGDMDATLVVVEITVSFTLSDIRVSLTPPAEVIEHVMYCFKDMRMF